MIHGTNPLSYDSDADGISDYDELCVVLRSSNFDQTTTLTITITSRTAMIMMRG